MIPKNALKSRSNSSLKSKLRPISSPGCLLVFGFLQYSSLGLEKSYFSSFYSFLLKSLIQYEIRYLGYFELTYRFLELHVLHWLLVTIGTIPKHNLYIKERNKK